jgi:hypothetical protein
MQKAYTCQKANFPDLAKSSINTSKKLLADHFDIFPTQFSVVAAYLFLLGYYQLIEETNRFAYYTDIIQTYINKWKNRIIDEQWECSLAGQIHNIRILFLENLLEHPFESDEDLTAVVKRIMYGVFVTRHFLKLRDLQNEDVLEQNSLQVSNFQLFLAIKADIDGKTNTHFKIDVNALDHLCSKYEKENIHDLFKSGGVYKWAKTCVLLLLAQGAKIEQLMSKTSSMNNAMKTAADYITSLCGKAPNMAREAMFAKSIALALQVHTTYLSSLHDKQERDQVIQLVKSDLTALRGCMEKNNRIAQKYQETVETFEGMLQKEQTILYQELVVNEFCDDVGTSELKDDLMSEHDNAVDDFLRDFFQESSENTTFCLI